MDEPQCSTMCPTSKNEHSYSGKSDKSHLLDYEYTVHTMKIEPKNVELWSFHSCKLCPYKTKSFYILRSHLRRHRVTRLSKMFICSSANIERYKCNQCDYRTTLLVNFNRHVDVSHRNPVKIKVEKDENGMVQPSMVTDNFNFMPALKSYNCEKCELKTYSQLFYVAHFRQCPFYVVNIGDCRPIQQPNEFVNWEGLETSEELKFQCSMCSYWAKRKTTLDGHMRVKHPFPKFNFFKKYRTTLKCTICRYTTRYKFCMRRHVQNVHSNRNFENVDRGFEVDKEMDESIEINDKEYSPIDKTIDPFYSCGKCKFQTTSQVGFQNHLLKKHSTDTDIRWYHCDHCNYKAVFQHYAERHQRVYHSNAAVQCDICSFSTTTKSGLRKHILSKHIVPDKEGQAAQKSKFNCELCTFKTTEQLELKNHILRNHISSEYIVCFKCQLCTYKTIEFAELREHVLEKHVDPQNKAWFECGMCDTKFRDRADLRMHVLEKHIL